MTDTKLFLFLYPFTLIILLCSQIINIPKANRKVIICSSQYHGQIGGQAHAESLRKKKSMSLINLAHLAALFRLI